MNWKFDPALSSADYLALARRRARHHLIAREFEWMLNAEHFNFGVHDRHVEQLLDRQNWSGLAIKASRKPRVFIEAHWNQSGNIEVRSIGGDSHGIYFEEDFSRDFLQEALAGHLRHHRSTGEIAWLWKFHNLIAAVLAGRSPVLKALLFGFKARLDELVREISAEIDVIGFTEMQFEYVGKNVSKVVLVPSLPIDEIRAIRRALFD